MNYQYFIQKTYHIFMLFVLIVFSKTAMALPIDSLRASSIAEKFMKYHDGNFTRIEFSYKNTNHAKTVMYYVFNLKNDNNNLKNGYVIITADDACFPILGYSTESKFDFNDLPIQLNTMLLDRAKEIAHIKEQGFEANNEIKQAWKAIENPTFATRTERTEGVNPLLTTKWHQSPFYNDLCPFDAQTNRKTFTGCVATSMAQVMKYYNHPKQGQGIYTYNHLKYGVLSADFGATTYEWANMPDRLTSQNSDVAKLMLHCGISVNMNYGTDVSSANAFQPSRSLYKYFSYDSLIKPVYRYNYKKSEWIILLKQELDAKRPIIYMGWGLGVSIGHVFVCDGYDDNSFFHMNWGWGGNADGYFNLRALNPQLESYDSKQAAIIGIKPATTIRPVTEIALSKPITITPNILSGTDNISINFNVKNNGKGIFKGKYLAVLYDTTYKYITQMGEIITNKPLNVGETYKEDLVFQQPKVILNKGSYYLVIFYQEEGGRPWEILSASTFSNPLKIIASNIEADLAMASSLKINTTNIYAKQPFTVEFNVKNLKNTTFEGDIVLNLYDFQWNLVKEIGVIPNLSLETNKVFPKPLLFSNNGADIEEGGVYILAPAYRYKNTTKLNILTAYTDAVVTYPSFLNFFGTALPLTKDKYEVNDYESQAFNLPVNVGDKFSVNTEGSNLHNVTDIDYYKLVLPAGFSYEVTPRVHDKDATNNRQTYTSDVLFSYKIGNSTYSDIFDVSINEQNGKISLINGGTVIFKVSPYFVDEVGTYLLDIQISSTKNNIPLSINDELFSNQIKVYPNPTKDIVNVQLPENTKIETLTVFNVMGQEMAKLDKQNSAEKISLDVSNYAMGIYYLYVVSDGKIGIKKISILK